MAASMRAESPMSLLRLNHTRSDGEIDTYHLKGVRRYHIGRGSACEVRILDMKMSRQHAAIEEIEDRWWLIDLGSTNGVRRDGQRVVERSELLAGSCISLGGTELEVLDIAACAERPLQRSPSDSELEPSTASGPRRLTGPLEPSAESAAARRAVAAAELANDQDAQVDADEQQDQDPTPPSGGFYDESATFPSLDDPQVGTSPIERQQGSVRIVTREVGRSASGSRPSSAPAAEQRSLYITVLGQRIGPLSRAEARDLKARELKGELTAADLEPWR